ncbi:MAG: hypothetical protein ABI282_04390, partial [Candidatus Baltobacteraceae bacterium]
IKLPALVAGVVIAARALANERRGMLPATILAIAIVLAAYARWSAGMRTALAPHGYFMPLASIAALPWSISSAIAPQTPLIAAGVTAIVVALATLVFASNAARYTGTDRYLLLALAGWILIPNPYPWYALWILPIAAFASDARLRRCGLWVTGIALLRYVLDAVAVPALATNAAMGLVAAIPYVATLRSLKRGIISGSP